MSKARNKSCLDAAFLASFACFLIITLSACSSGGSDTDPVSSDTGQVAGGNVDGGDISEGDDVLEEGDAPIPDIINANNARTVSTEVLELVDSLTFFSLTIPEALIGPTNGDSQCAGGGSQSVVESGSNLMTTFSDCIFFQDNSISLNGIISAPNNVISGTYSGELTFDSLQATDNGRVVTVDGSVIVETENSVVQANEASLVINDSQSDTVLSNSSYVIDSSSGDEFNLEFNIDSVFERFATEPLFISSDELTGASPSCPSSGSINVAIETGETILTISGNVGGNLLFTAGLSVDTLNCLEVPSLLDIAVETAPPIFQPPPAPQ